MCIEDTLKALDTLVQAQRPLLHEVLNPGATQVELASLAQRLPGKSIPSDIEILLRWHNGQKATCVTVRENGRLRVLDAGELKPGYEFLSIDGIIETIGSYGELVEDEVIPTLLSHFLPIFHTSGRRDIGVLVGIPSKFVAVDVEEREIYVLSENLENFLKVILRCMQEGLYERRTETEEQYDFLLPSEAERAVIRDIDGDNVFPRNTLGVTRFTFDDRSSWPVSWK